MWEVWRLVSFSIHLLSTNTNEDIQYRNDLANAIVSVTNNEHEQQLLMSTVRYESSFFVRLGSPQCECRRNECDGGRARGPWQIIPRSKIEKESLCVSLEQDAKLALSRVRESLRACWRSPPNERLALYLRGNCSNEDGKRLSRIRWVQ